ncbi:MAG: alpha/beta hydrolase [Gemmatimonadaceae bacterium]|nr:alpha/beta hydrolase [Gemmatimonadaceae bacterium]
MLPSATDHLTMRDGVPLALQQWAPASAAIGTIVIAHGLGEHVGRYAQLAGELTGAGWLVRAADHRGHGRSPGVRGAIPAEESVRDDLIEQLVAARATTRGPVVLLGHSMGGAFAAWAIAHQPDAADALILSSPALVADLSAVQRALMNTMRHVAPNLTVGNGLDVSFISHDRAVIDAYTTDPLVHDRVSSRLARAIMTAGAAARGAAAQWRTPTLLIYAGDDRLVNPRGSQAFAASAPAGVVTARRFDGFYHELFNETERARPVRAVLDWLGELAGPQATAG